MVAFSGANSNSGSLNGEWGGVDLHLGWKLHFFWYYMTCMQVKKEAPAVVNPVAMEASNKGETTEGEKDKDVKDEEEKKENKPLDDLFR